MTWLIHIHTTHIYERVMSNICMSHVTHMNESCHTSERVMSHIWTSHVQCKNELRLSDRNASCHTNECFMSHTRLSHVARTNCNVTHFLFKCTTAHAYITHYACITYNDMIHAWHSIHTQSDTHTECYTHEWSATYVSVAKEPYKRDYILQKRPTHRVIRTWVNCVTWFMHDI